MIGQFILTWEKQSDFPTLNELSNIFSTSDFSSESSKSSNRVDVCCQCDPEPQLEQELVVLKRLIAEHDRTSSVLSDAKRLLGCSPPHVIRILHVRPTFVSRHNANGVSFEMSRLSELSQRIPGLQIKVKTIAANAFPQSRFVNPHLRK
jgi:hypothetical protein